MTLRDTINELNVQNEELKRLLSEPLHNCNDKDHWSNVIIWGKCDKCEHTMEIELNGTENTQNI